MARARIAAFAAAMAASASAYQLPLAGGTASIPAYDLRMVPVEEEKK